MQRQKQLLQEKPEMARSLQQTKIYLENPDRLHLKPKKEQSSKPEVLIKTQWVSKVF